MSATVLAVTLLIAPTQMPTEPPQVLTNVKETGAEPSAYVGKYYDARNEGYRKCIAHREGRHQYWGTGSNGMYVGTYQMTRPLAAGAVWMMSKEWRAHYGKDTARQMRETLHSTHPRQWSRAIWDQAFWTVLNWEGPMSGAFHWRGGRYGCNPGMTYAGGDR